MLKRLFRPTNLRVRLVVGVLLAAVFCIQCTSSDPTRSSQLVADISAAGPTSAPAQKLSDLEKLAKSDHIALLKQSLAHYKANYRCYICTLVKHERINGQLQNEQWIDVKFMESPFSVSMHWTKNSPLGDRVLYVEGKYNGNMLINPANALLLRLTGTVQREPQSKDAMANTLRPVTQFGFRRMMESLLDIYELAAQRKEGAMQFKGYQEVAGVKAMVLQRDLPARNDYPAKTTVWYLDPQRLVPLGMVAYDWSDQLICSYIYKDIKLDADLDQEDFSPQANQMKLR